MRHALPRMAEANYGRVINIASVHGLVASVRKAAYVSAKFGLVGLSKVAALEYAGIGSAESLKKLMDQGSVLLPEGSISKGKTWNNKSEAFMPQQLGKINIRAREIELGPKFL